MKLMIRLAAVTAMLVLVACGSPGAANGGAAPDAGTVQVTMNAQDVRFDPNTLTARPGEKVALTVSNHDGFKHNFTISELGVNEDIDAGKTVTLVFTTKGNSDLQFFCEYHKARGMVGTLNLSGVAPSAAPSPSSDEAKPAASKSPYSAY